MVRLLKVFWIGISKNKISSNVTIEVDSQGRGLQPPAKSAVVKELSQ